ncbi:hypothetical protein Aph02nite_44890 [Actinoplanes philippinensis]|nr:hypothetical protein Aph02nite_44890 [Actinoplanes philippinensis]
MVGKRYLKDTSRNGAGGTSGDWCDPAGFASKTETGAAEFLIKREGPDPALPRCCPVRVLAATGGRSSTGRPGGR